MVITYLPNYQARLITFIKKRVISKIEVDTVLQIGKLLNALSLQN